MTAVDFPTSVFTNPSSAQRNLRTLHELFIASGSQYQVDDFSLAIQRPVVASPEPDRAITNLLRFCEATLSRASLFNDLVKYPVALEVLAAILGQSQYLADILVRDPELFRWLTASDVLMTSPTTGMLVSEVQRIERMFQKPEKRLDSLRRLYRREVLRIGARDILGNATLETTTRDLSCLADILVEAACRIAEKELAEKFGGVPKTPYAVIGLGKLGGGELNYSSDIDIVFVYGDEGTLPGGKKATHHEFFNKLVERFVHFLTEASGEGHLYRVDTRLRPESGMGPLARSVQSYLLYYESRGELWERQMLIKGRPVAGDRAFGEQFMRQLTPFIFPRTFFSRPTEAITRIKERIEAAVGSEENIKLQSGGIRDIEFIVQALQLVNGGRSEAIRSPNTLEAIDQLVRARFLTDHEGMILTVAYRFFRTLEHRLQTVLNTQTHTLPGGPEAMLALARKLGMQTGQDLRRAIDEHRREVTRIFKSVMKGDDAADQPAGIEAILDGEVGEERVSAILSTMGFRDGHRAAKILRSMVSGGGLSGDRVLDVRGKEALRSVSDRVFPFVVQSPDPETTLNNIALLAGAAQFPGQFFRELQEEGFRKLVLTVCASSTRLTRGLARDGLLMELLSSNRAILAQPWDGKRPRGMSVALLKSREELRAGIRFVLGLSSFRDFTVELSRLADEALASVFEEECRKQGSRRPALALFAVGKFGTRELSLDADLDLIFVGEQKSKAASDMMEKIASSLIRRMTDVGGAGKLYDIDARLRPEGRSAPLVVDKRAYAHYLEQRASLWERQSLTRLRFVCGDADLGEEVAKVVSAFVYEAPLNRGWTAEIVSMRRKVETRSHVRTSAFHDVKLGAGGMVDIEFLAQMLQLRYGRENRSLRFHPTTEMIARSPAEILSREDASRLIGHYHFFRRIELAIRISMEERGTVLPSGDQLEILARHLGHQGSAGLLHAVADGMKWTREKFLKCATLLSESHS
jgi:[glutamine synthetase] adenylyltransferase / [glutamine synthetase]-adenylyl-L-tyrosine phosphorylase